MADTPSWTLVIGALGGLGTAMVDRLLAAGHSVVACDRRAVDYTARVAAYITGQTIHVNGGLYLPG